jgi:hypothetical protein
MHGDRTKRYTVKPVVKSDTTVYDPPLKGLIIFFAAAADTLTIHDWEGNVKEIALPDVSIGGRYPWELPLLIRKVMATGTTIENTEMMGIH